MTFNPAPRRGSIRMPAEWEPCEAVYLAWPHSRETWPGQFDKVPLAFTRVVAAIARTHPVRVLADDALAGEVDSSLAGIANWQRWPIPTNDAWLRDTGPTFVWHGSQLAAVDWRFNAWGGKYRPYHHDAAVAGRIAQRAALPTIAGGITAEGGALETDGAGRLIVVAACLVDPKRNASMDADAIAGVLHQKLGVTEILWLDDATLAGDDTDGHVDQLVRFVTPTDVVVAVSHHGDENDVSLAKVAAQVRIWAGKTSPTVTVHELPVPPPARLGGYRLPQSYCNFLMLGADRILLPTFGASDFDHAAAAVLQSIRPDTRIDTVDCSVLTLGLGALHCLTCGQPAVG